MDSFKVGKRISSIVVVPGYPDKIVVGLYKGVIEIYEIKYPFEQRFISRLGERRGDVGRVIKLHRMSENRIFAFSNNNGAPTGRIWTLRINHLVELDFSTHGFQNGFVDGAAELQENLIAVSGKMSDSTRGFHVFDSITGKCIHSEKGIQQYVIEIVKSINDFVAISDEKLSIWKITKETCVKISNSDKQIGTNTVALPTGEIFVTGGSRQVSLFKVDINGQLQLVQELYFRNCIDHIFHVDGYRILTQDRGDGDSGILRIWDLTQNLDKPNGAEVETMRHLTGYYHDYDDREKLITAFFPASTLLLMSKINHVFWNWNNEDVRKALRRKDEVAEIRKVSRLLAQAQRSVEEGSIGLGNLPTEVMMQIVKQIWESLPYKQYDIKCAMKTAEVFFGKPDLALK